MTNDTLTAVEGIRVGHFTDADSKTGCTVIALPEGNTVAAEVRGAAPATREFGLLAPGMTVQSANAIVLSGGSAYGLATADGVMRALEREGSGYKTAAAVVPIVPAACLYDLAVGDGAVRPDADAGEMAFAAASTNAVPVGPVGAGTGATCGKWRGEKIAAGLGSAAMTVDGVTVAALVAVNALGDVFTLEGEPVTGGAAVPGPRHVPPAQNENTTLAVLATNAALDRAQLQRLIVRAHDAFGVCLRPAHTVSDGDICFGVATGAVTDGLAPHNLAEAAFEVIGRSIERAIT